MVYKWYINGIKNRNRKHRLKIARQGKKSHLGDGLVGDSLIP